MLYCCRLLWLRPRPFCGVCSFENGFSYAAPFLLGLALALILDVPISFLETRGWPRPVLSFGLVALSFLALPALLGLFLVKLWQELQGLVALGLVGQLTQEFSEHVLAFLEKIPFAQEWDPADFFPCPRFF